MPFLPELWGAVIFYNDGPHLLKECFQSCRAAGLKGIVAVDGAFQEFPHTDYHSTDGSLEAAREQADIVIEAPGRPWANECEKRSEYFRRIKSGNYALWIDADEILEGGIIDRRALCHDYYRVGLVNSTSTETAVRCFRVYKNLVHKNRHPVVCRSYENRFEPYNTSYFVRTESGYLKIRHRPELRPRQRLDLDAVFMRERQENLIRTQSESSEEKKVPYPKPNAEGINRWVKVKFKGDFFYSGHLIAKTSDGGIYPVPYWRYLELIQIHGKEHWELCEQL